MVIEGRVSTLGGHHRITRLYKHTNNVTQQTIDPLSYHDVTGLNSVVRCDCLVKHMIFRVTVHPGSTGCLSDSSHYHGRRAKYAFVCTDPCVKRSTSGPLLRFRPHKRHRCRQCFCELCKSILRQSFFLVWVPSISDHGIRQGGAVPVCNGAD